MNKPVLYIDDNFKIPDYIEKIPEEVRKLMIEDLVAETRKNMMLNSDRQKKIATPLYQPEKETET